MNAEHRAPIRLDERVEQMDMELKEHFVEFRTFVGESLASLETRLTKRFDSRFDAMDKRLDGLQAQFRSLEAKLEILLRRQTGGAKRRARATKRRRR